MTDTEPDTSAPLPHVGRLIAAIPFLLIGGVGQWAAARLVGVAKVDDLGPTLHRWQADADQARRERRTRDAAQRAVTTSLTRGAGPARLVDVSRSRFEAMTPGGRVVAQRAARQYAFLNPDAPRPAWIDDDIPPP